MDFLGLGRLGRSVPKIMINGGYNGLIMVNNGYKYGFGPENVGLIFPMKFLPFKNGIMISKTIGFRGLAYFQTHPYRQ